MERCDYFGSRNDDGNAVVTFVTVSEDHVMSQPIPLPLEPSLAIANHSPDGFEWGYHGSGPAQLALAILLHVTGNPAVAERDHQQFKREFIARLPREGWQLSARDIRAYLSNLAFARAHSIPKS